MIFINGLERFQKTFSHDEPDRVPISTLGVNSPVSAEILGYESCTGIGAKTFQKKFAMMQKSQLADFFMEKARDEMSLNRLMDLDGYFLAGNKIFTKETKTVKQIEPNKWKLGNGKKWRVWQADPESGFAGEVDSWIKEGGIEAFQEHVKDLEDRDISLENYSFKVFDDVIEKFGDEIAIFGNADVGIPFEKSWFSVFLKASITHPSLVERYLDAKLEETMLLLREQLDRGIFSVWGGVDWASTKDIMLTKDFFESIVKPRLVKIVSLCHEHDTVYAKHTDGDINKIIESLIIDTGVDGLLAIEPNAGMDIYELKKEYGEKLTFLGNVDCSTTLVNGTRKEIRAEVKRLIKNIAPGGGYVMMSSNSIHSGVPPQNWRTMVEAAKEFGSYPIQL